MNLFGTPFSISQLHLDFLSFIEDLANTAVKTSATRKFSFIYFSYSQDFDYLTLSLRSLVRFVPDSLIESVHLFVDTKGVFSEQQIDILTECCPAIHLHEVEDFSWASTETTLAELRAFQEVAQMIPSSGIISKVDSDILFIPNRRLQRIANRSQATIGDGHYTGYQYAQGGLYFIDSEVVRELYSEGSLVAAIKTAECKCGQNGEDAVISEILRNRGTGFKLRRFMLFPDEYRRTKSFTHKFLREFCALHCVQDKTSMRGLLELLLKQSN